MTTLHVSGTSYLHTTYVNSPLYYNSDERLKKRIRKLPFDSLAFLADLKPVAFQWKRNGEDLIGLLAQDVQRAEKKHRLVGTMVSGGAEDGMLALAYDQLIPVLIDAVNTLSAKVRVLEQAQVKA